jgi:S1-C subfamily serine protease
MRTKWLREVLVNADPYGNCQQVPWGFSLSWGRPPRVERVDPVSPAERSGLKPGDYVVFVESTNVVTQPREEVLELIQAATSQLILEVYRRSGQGAAPGTAVLPAPSLRRPSTINPTSIQPSQHRAIAFTAEVGTGVLV